MIELEHSPLGGSSAKRFMTCAGSFLKQREAILDGTFEDIPTEFAEIGTAAHELGAICLATDTEPFEYLGETFNGYRAGWEGELGLDAVQVYVNECRAVMDLCDYDGLAVVEKTYKAPHLHKLLKGTVDFGYLSPSRGLFLRDYKNGEGVAVSVVNNFQLLYYAFLMLVDSEATQFGEENWTADTPVNLGIVQPNYYGIFEDVETWIVTVDFVWNWGHKVLLPEMHRLYEAGMTIRDSDFVPGDHCQFCPVLLECPVMQRAFKEYADASEDFITMLTNEELDHLYSQREYARRFMTALERVVYARKIAGGNIASAKLVEPMTARVWKPGAEAQLKATFGEKAYAPRKVLSPAAIEKLSSRGKELALEYGFKPDANRLTIAPLSDRRPEAKPRTNATVFEAHAQSPQDMGF